ncbi:MAG: SRPBCC family protein [Dongiaceae bacterium]
MAPERRISYPVADDAEVKQGRFWWMWPTTTFNMLPGAPDISVFSFMPTSVGSKLQIGQCFGVPDATPDVARHNYRTGVLTDEDISLCESVQRGLASRGYSSGRFMYDATAGILTEAAAHHFHRMVVARSSWIRTVTCCRPKKSTRSYSHEASQRTCR